MLLNQHRFCHLPSQMNYGFYGASLNLCLIRYRYAKHSSYHRHLQDQSDLQHEFDQLSLTINHLNLEHLLNRLNHCTDDSELNSRTFPSEFLCETCRGLQADFLYRCHRLHHPHHHHHNPLNLDLLDQVPRSR